MRDKWYGDARDVVKWGVLAELARRYGASHILQVLYYRSTTWPTLTIDGERVALAQSVLAQLRSCARVAGIQCGVTVELFDEPFERRDEYHRRLIQRLATRTATPSVVLLDPDTGLAPRNPDLGHVLDSEARAVWDTLSPGDVLVMYQHQTNRNNSPWIEPKRIQFERALGVADGSSKVAQAPEIARDVVLLFALKDYKGQAAHS